jgi:ATP-dependent DNA ligase
MLKSPFEPCIPSGAKSVPDSPAWIHEIKHDGYRLIVQRDCKGVRLWTRNGHDWSNRFPLISEAALRNRNSSFVIDGEAVLLGVDGISDFNGLHSRKHDDEVSSMRFDIPGAAMAKISRRLAAIHAKNNPPGCWHGVSMDLPIGLRTG